MNSIYEVRILIVDDNKDLLRLLCEQLSGAGYRHIQTAANCAAAKKLFAAEIPELMILDINLPDGDGFSLFCSVPCMPKQTFRLFFSPQEMPMRIVYLDSDLVQMIT